ncbi:MAG: CPBP family intramembrane metalloprotease [Oscillospiraceae bacterium]|nr:CPBP family intramembrane metalloprotease [Oscillospiraceae bacterium]
MTPKRNLTVLHIGIYLVIFFAVWSIRELYIRPVFLDSLDGIAFGLVESAIKLLVWTLPAVLLIRHFHDNMWIGLKAMFTNKIKWSRDYYFLMAIIAIPIVRALSAWFVSGEVGIHPNFVPTRLLQAVVFVGVTEEVVFRGFLLNAFLKKIRTQYAIALDAALFTLIHYPIWIYRDFDLSDFATASIAVAVLSVGFAYSFIKTRNIFVPMALHMVWNLSIHLFSGS